MTRSATGRSAGVDRSGEEPHHGRQTHPHDQRRQPRRRQSELDHGRPARSGPPAGLSVDREADAPEPRAHSRAAGPRQGLGRARHADHHRGHLQIHQGEGAAARQEDADDRPLLDGRRRARRRRRRARRARLRPQVLHRGRQLGPRRQQHAGLLRPRRLQVPRLHPHPEAPPAHPSALADGDVGFLVAQPGKPAPDHDPLFGSRPADRRPPHQRLRLAHLLADQCAERAVLGEIPLQDHAGPPALDQRRGRRHRRPDARVDAGGPVRRDRGRQFPEVEDAGPDHAGDRRRQAVVQPVRPDQGLAARRLSR